MGAQQASVDFQILASDVARALRCQKGDDRGDFGARPFPDGCLLLDVKPVAENMPAWPQDNDAIAEC
jgi:hypothetical protein